MLVLRIFLLLLFSRIFKIESCKRHVGPAGRRAVRVICRFDLAEIVRFAAAPLRRTANSRIARAASAGGKPKAQIRHNTRDAAGLICRIKNVGLLPIPRKAGRNPKKRRKTLRRSPAAVQLTPPRPYAHKKTAPEIGSGFLFRSCANYSAAAGSKVPFAPPFFESSQPAVCGSVGLASWLPCVRPKK